jgi:Carbohydrate-binding module family 5/12
MTMDTNERAARGILGIALHMARSLELARRVTSMRQHGLARRLARDPHDLRLNARHELIVARAVAYEASAARIRESLPGLAVLAAAGVTQEQFDNVGLGDVVRIPAPTEWRVDTEYAVGAQVAYRGRTYVCLIAHTSRTGNEPPNVPAQWVVHGSAPSSDGVEWRADFAYAVGRTVTYEGVSYTCREAHTSRICCPPPHQPALWAAPEVDKAPRARARRKGPPKRAKKSAKKSEET